MGPLKVEVPSPKNFLQKHSKEPKLSEKNLEKRIDKNAIKPHVPQRTEHPIMGLQTKKNFVNTNAVEAIVAVPKDPQPIFVDTKKGDKHFLEASGLVPKYINKKDYGITPQYLLKRNEEVIKAQEEYDTYVKERLRQGAMKQLSDEERESVLQGLKKNWDELHYQYQGLSVVIDTTPKKYRKERLEMEMKQLERDIGIIERHKVIYIANN
ncbi:enkurin isoform X2 [Latimeria chalumnae]